MYFLAVKRLLNVVGLVQKIQTPSNIIYNNSLKEKKNQKRVKRNFFFEKSYYNTNKKGKL
jgi:hypothetical protein